MSKFFCWIARVLPLTLVFILVPLSYAHASPDDCRVDVRSIGVFWPGRHLFIVATDPGNHQTGYRGGPSQSGGSSSSSSGGGSGDENVIITTVGPYDPSFIDWDPNATSRTVLAGPDACGKGSCFAGEAARIDQTRTPYNVFGPNSNTVVSTMLHKCGVPHETPGGWHPGWDHPDI